MQSTNGLMAKGVCKCVSKKASLPSAEQQLPCEEEELPCEKQQLPKVCSRGTRCLTAKCGETSCLPGEAFFTPVTSHQILASSHQIIHCSTPGMYRKFQVLLRLVGC